MWSERSIQHSTDIGPARNGLFERVRSLPASCRYENALAVANHYGFEALGIELSTRKVRAARRLTLNLA